MPEKAEPIISVISASIDSPEWAELLVKSVRKFTTIPYEIIIVDNGSLPQNLKWLRAQSDILLVEMRGNTGHGPALDLGTQLSRGRYVCALDIDAHVQRKEWEMGLIRTYHSNPLVRLIGCRGPDHKPLKPPLFFFERGFVLSHNLSFRYIPGVSTDTAQKIYHDILSLGYEVIRLIPETHIYDASGDQFYVDGLPLTYHQWYGTRFNDNNPSKLKQELDGYKLEDYLREKARLFNQPLVQEILKYD